MRSHFRSLRRLNLESLESRTCLSLAPVFDQGVLTIDGTPDADQIAIVDNGLGSIGVADRQANAAWEFKGVSKIVVNAGDGKDVVKYSRANRGDAPIPVLDFNGGGDDDAISLLLPAVQKVREAAARVHIDLGTGNDQLNIQGGGVQRVDLDLSAGEGDDQILIGLLLPAVQNLGDGSVRLAVDLGGGNDTLRASVMCDGSVDVLVTGGDGDDNVGLLLPAVQKIREAAMQMKFDLGAGQDVLNLTGIGSKNVDLDVVAGEGDDRILIGLLLPAVQTARSGVAHLHLDLGGGGDQLKLNAAGYDDVMLDVAAGDGDDQILIGLLLPAVQKVRASAHVHVDLGPGTDSLLTSIHGYDVVDSSVVADQNDTVQTR